MENTILLILFLASCVLTPALSELCNPQDKQALLQIKKELGNPTALSSWLPTTDCCSPTWPGILCDPTFRIFLMELSDYNFNLSQAHSIPPSIANLTYLDSLSLTRIPNLIGPIPSTLTRLTRLKHLTISHTNISGNVPHFLSKIKTLLTIDLSNNNLSGNLSPSLSSLPNLSDITLNNNRISGPIPDSFGSFANLLGWRISRNRLSGKIPATLAKLNLAFVDLSQNMLEGDASVLFGTWKHTRYIFLSKNSLAFDSGKVRLPKKLEGLDISRNRIYGRLPQGLTALKSLRWLKVSFNNLCGEIPQGGSLRRFNASSYVYNKCLCASPLPPCKAY
ncbi:hypothetical protein RJT34_04059 [Clitoria ternatea]|uniref:Leucine-rich repeat-containing N-terminal plant-type domain-containing protein n=1 Tax=Clitoria ternatea TaxID=43366 RepID=A0AAN9Q0A0_CLITE